MFDFGPEVQLYNNHCKRILSAVADYSYNSLNDAGVKLKPATATFYLFPDFIICKKKLKESGVETGQQFCDTLFDEQKVAVSHITRIKEVPYLFQIRHCIINYSTQTN